MRDLFSGLAYFFGVMGVGALLLLALLVVSGNAHAANTTPHTVTTTYTDASGNQRMADMVFKTSYQAANGQQMARYTQAQTTISKASAAAMVARAIAKMTPAGRMASVALMAAGYIVNEQTGEVMSEGSSPGAPVMMYGKSGHWYETAEEACTTALGSGSFHHAVEYSTYVECYVEDSTGAVNYLTYFFKALRCPPDGADPDTTKPLNEQCLITTQTPVAPEQITDNLGENQDEIIEQSARESVNDGSWPSTWPELQTTINNINNNVEYYFEGNTTVTPTAQAPEQMAQSGDDKFPGFCEWAKPLCDWMNWTREAPDPEDPQELPSEEIDIVQWDSGLGSGSCPSPEIVSVFGQPLSLSFEPMCSFVSMLRPLLLALTGLGATFIILGIRPGAA